MESTMINELRACLDNTPMSQLLKEWQEIERLGFSGPNAVEYIAIAFENCQIDYVSPPDVTELLTNFTTPRHSASFFY